MNPSRPLTSLFSGAWTHRRRRGPRALHTPVCNLWGALALLLVALLGLAAAQGRVDRGTTARAILWPAAAKGHEAPTFTNPRVVARGGSKRGSPTWSRARLWTAPPSAMGGLATVEKPGLPTYDETTRAWYASANGCLVRLDGARLVVLTCGVQGVDVHVRASLGLAVSREPDHSIVLHRFGAGKRSSRILLTGSNFCTPRLGPSGAVLVSESRPGGGRIWLVDRRGRAVDLGPGVHPVWRGRRVIFSRLRHDGSRVLGADLWQVDPRTRKVTRLTRTAGVAETDPAVSPDGRWVAYVDALTGDLLVARLPGRRP